MPALQVTTPKRSGIFFVDKRGEENAMLLFAPRDLACYATNGFLTGFPVSRT